MRLHLALSLVVAVRAASPALAQNFALRDVTVYTSPQAQPQSHTTLLVQDGRIAAISPHAIVPAATPTLACTGCVVFAGFWNTHVHFTGPQWDDAAHQTAGALARDLEAMLTHSGFTTVVDTASDPRNTTALSRRIESGELLGPHILTAGSGLYPPHGIPFYLGDLPASVRAQLPQPETSAAAIQAVDRNVAAGSDLVKLFVGSYLSPDHITHMPVEIARAAVAEGHRQHQLVFAHPSDLEGVRIALASGVDVLAHAPDTVDGIDDAFIHTMATHFAMTPTLKLFSGSGHIARIREIVARFHAAGGVLLFGTDTGFLTDFDVTEEYHQLALAGLSFPDVLAMLTTAPATLLLHAPGAGTLHVGASADLTILAADPARTRLEDFTRVRYTIRTGRVLFAASTSHLP